MSKVALITGITGQDGAYLAEYLIKKGYIVHGIKRRSSMFNTDRIDHLYQDPHVENRNLILHYGDLTDSLNLTRIIGEIQPDEIYNLAAMSHVKVSFDTPEYTANADGLGVLRILEAVRPAGGLHTLRGHNLLHVPNHVWKKDSPYKLFSACLKQYGRQPASPYESRRFLPSEEIHG